MGWWLASHAQTNPSGGFQGGVILATAFILIYLAGEFLAFKRFSPVDLTEVVEAVGAGGFAAIGVAAVAMGLPYLKDFLPLGTVPGAVSSAGTIPLISFFVGLEVAAAFILIVGELLEQTLLHPARRRLMQYFPFRRRGLDPRCRPLRHRHQPRSHPPDHLPDRRPVLHLRAAARASGYVTGAVAPYFYDVPPHTPAVDPVVQALALTDVVVEAAVTALLLSFAIQAHKRFGTLDPQELASS